MATLQEQIDAQTSGSTAGMTMMPGQTQAEGTTGQLAPPAPEAPQQPPTPQVQLEEPTVSPTAISTDSMREQLQGAEDTLRNMQAEIDAGKQVQPEVPEEQPAPTVTQTGDQTEVDPYQSEIAQYTTATNKILDERKNDFNRFLTRSDKLLKSQVRSIQKTFDVRRDQAQDVATNAIAASKVLGSRFGRQRYAPEIQAGIVTGKENALITTLSEIDALEAEAMAAAEGAAFTRDYTTFLDKIDDLDTIRKERETTLNELESAMKEENKRRDTEAELAKNETQVIEQIAGGVTDPIEIFTALNGNVPYDIVKQYTDTLPSGGDTEFEFIKGDKYNSTGYFDPTTGDFVNIGIGSGGGLTVGGQNVPSVGQLDMGTITPEDIDMLPISGDAKAVVKLYAEGRITQEEILQRYAGDKADRALRNEVVGVIAQLEQPAQINLSKARDAKTKATNAIANVDTALALLDGSAAGAKGRVFFGKEDGGIWGIGGYLGSGGDNATFVATVDSLKGMVAFGELQSMRDNSPTGGALGQVTERELDLLAAQIASLDIRQDDTTLKTNLNTIRDSFKRVELINDPTTTVKEYKNNFPDAPESELTEIRLRNQGAQEIEVKNSSNQNLLLGDEDAETDLVPSALDSL